MNGEWIFQILLILVSVLLSAPVAYFFGVKQQKKQVLRKHIIDIAKDEYPLLFDEIRRNSEYLDTYLENPDYAFPFPRLKNFFDRGLDDFMKKHHKNLFLKIDFFQKEVLSKIKELDLLTMKTKEKIFDYWFKYLTSSLPKEMAKESERIASDLIKNVGSHYVLTDLLNERDEEIRNKIEKCFWNRTSHIHREKAKRPFVIEGERQEISFEEISQTLMEKAKPHIASLKRMFKELKMQNDKEVKAELLPLLQKYISNPI